MSRLYFADFRDDRYDRGVTLVAVPKGSQADHLCGEQLVSHPTSAASGPQPLRLRLATPKIGTENRGVH